MGIPSRLDRYIGHWVGQNRLWITPTEPVRESATIATVVQAAQGKFVEFRYTWSEEGRPQDGVMLIGQEQSSDKIQAIWIDSWHMGYSVMVCQGQIDPQGVLKVLGSYPAPSGLDWGWRINFDPGDADSLHLTMLNISPQGKEELAVEASYRRKPEVEIIPYQTRWPVEFQGIAATLRQGLGNLALRIDHIGSTSVPGLASKDVIDIQITVAVFDQRLTTAMQAMGYTQSKGIWSDHRPAYGAEQTAEWEKWLFRPPAGQRRTHIHVRLPGRSNQRYPLLFRDYLRSHPAMAESYAELKRRLAQGLADPLTYPEVKDPAVDLIYLAAEDWAKITRWQPAPSDG
jgi:GrpB-like predicted nucleotidyltransferase (UPF0157 family)